MLLTDLEQVEFFEGTEKLLEVWFKVADDAKADLRGIPRIEWERLVKTVRAEVVSYKSNEFIDSFVLSESSMFVSRNRFVIKTCGTTKVLACLEPLMQLAKRYCNLTELQDFFYSRRVYLKPDEQESPHQSFKEELDFFEKYLPNGAAFVFGNTKGEEWYLYTLDNKMDGIQQPDATLEILMSNLNTETMLQFTKACYPLPEQMTKASGIDDLIPGALYDGMVFDPIGYSMNGLLKESYHTIHITPQPNCSYVSFETNIQMNDYTALVERVLKTFKPGKFIITLFANKAAACGQANAALDNMQIKGYHCIDLEHANLKNYTLSYGHYRKAGY